MFLLILVYTDLLFNYSFFIEANIMNMFLEKDCRLEAKNIKWSHLILVYIICKIGDLEYKQMKDQIQLSWRLEKG